MKKLVGEQLNQPEIDEILRDVDLNGDGLLDFEGEGRVWDEGEKVRGEWEEKRRRFGELERGERVSEEEERGREGSGRKGCGEE